MIPNPKCRVMGCCLIAAACGAGAQPAPRLSIALLPPSYAQISWPSNFIGWQLASTTSLTPPVNWQPVPGTPFPLGGALVIFAPLTNHNCFFRLQPGGSCGFQATPLVISPGGSSLLTWCRVAGTTYTLTPGPGLVPGSSYSVSPTVTTMYSLIASNAAGIIPSFTTVIVSSSGPCAFASVSAWDCTLSFSYEFSPPAADTIFHISQEAHLTFHLTPAMVSPIGAEFTGYASGSGQLNDSVQDLTRPPPNTTTLIGSGAPQQDPTEPRTSRLTLDIDCLSGTYTFTITPAITATQAGPSGTVTGLFGVGKVSVDHRALPAALGPLSNAGFLPARGPLWTGGGDLYLPGGLGLGMFFGGVVNDNSAGSASVNFTLVPIP